MLGWVCGCGLGCTVNDTAIRLFLGAAVLLLTVDCLRGSMNFFSPWMGTSLRAVTLAGSERDEAGGWTSGTEGSVNAEGWSRGAGGWSLKLSEMSAGESAGVMHRIEEGLWWGSLVVVVVVLRRLQR